LEVSIDLTAISRKYVVLFLVLLGLTASGSAVSPALNWSLDGSAPPTDSSGNNYDGVCSGSPLTGVNAQFDTGYAMDGVDDVCAINNSLTWDGDSPVTISMWAKIPSNPNPSFGQFWGWSDQDNSGSHIDFNSDGGADGDAFRVFIDDGTDTGNIEGSTNVRDGNFHHFVFTRGSSDNFEIWVDNNSEGALTDASLDDLIGSGNNPSFEFGRVGAANDFINASYDEISVGLFEANDSVVSELYSNNKYDAPAPNSAPTASFTIFKNDLTVDVDSSGSSDDDGSISSYEWDWTSDGNYEGSGQTASHTYGSSGSYNITLRVTDDDGATSTSKQEVTVSSSSDGFDPTIDAELYFGMDGEPAANGGTVVDESPNSNDGTTNGDINTGVEGVSGKGFELSSSTSDWVSFPNINRFDGSKPFSVSIWMNASSFSGTQFLWTGRGESNIYSGFGFPNQADDQFAVRLYDGSTYKNVLADSTSLQAGEVYNYQITYDGSGNWGLYRNNTQVDTATGESSITSLSRTNGIGDDGQDGSYIDARVDEFIVDDKSWSSSERESIYALEYDGGTVQNVSAPENITVTYRGDDKIGLDWDSPTGASTVEVRRNGSYFTDIDDGLYTADNLDANTSYEFNLTAVGSSNENSTQVTVSTRPNLTYKTGFLGSGSFADVSSVSVNINELENSTTVFSGGNSWNSAGVGYPDIEFNGSYNYCDMWGYAGTTSSFSSSFYINSTGCDSFTDGDETELSMGSFGFIDVRKTDSGSYQALDARDSYTSPDKTSFSLVESREGNGAEDMDDEANQFFKFDSGEYFSFVQEGAAEDTRRFYGWNASSFDQLSWNKGNLLIDYVNTEKQVYNLRVERTTFPLGTGEYSFARVTWFNKTYDNTDEMAIGYSTDVTEGISNTNEGFISRDDIDTANQHGIYAGDAINKVGELETEMYWDLLKKCHDTCNYSTNDRVIKRGEIKLNRYGGMTGSGNVVTKSLNFGNDSLVLNADASGGSLDVEVLDSNNDTISGYSYSDFNTLSSDTVRHEGSWSSSTTLPSNADRLNFSLSSATL